MAPAARPPDSPEPPEPPSASALPQASSSSSPGDDSKSSHSSGRASSAAAAAAGTRTARAARGVDTHDGTSGRSSGGGGPSGGPSPRSPLATTTAAAAGASAATATGYAGRLYLSYESAVVTLVLIVVSYLVFAPAHHRRRLRDALERMMCPLNVRQRLRRKRMERELLRSDVLEDDVSGNDGDGRSGDGAAEKGKTAAVRRRRRYTFHRFGRDSAAANAAAKATKARAQSSARSGGSVVKLLSRSPRANSKPKFASPSSSSRAANAAARARLTGAASAPTLPMLPSSSDDGAAASDFIASLEPQYPSLNDSGHHSLCTGLVMPDDGEGADNVVENDEDAPRRTMTEEERFAVMYRRSIKNSMYGGLVLPPECRLVEPPKGKTKKKGEKGNEGAGYYGGILGWILSLFRPIRDRIKLLMTIDVYGEWVNVLLRLARAVQYRRNRELGRPTGDEEEDDDDDASLASLASLTSRGSVRSRSGSAVATAATAAAGVPPPRPSQIPVVTGGAAATKKAKSTAADARPAQSLSSSLFLQPRRPSNSSLVEEAAETPSSGMRPSSSSPPKPGEAPQSLPKRPSSTAPPKSSTQPSSFPPRPSAATFSPSTGEAAQIQTRGGVVGSSDRFYSVERHSAQYAPSAWGEEKKDFGPEEERRTVAHASHAGRRGAGTGEAAAVVVADKAENDVGSADGGSSVAKSSLGVLRPQRQETMRRESRSKSPTPLALLPPRKRDALESYRSKSISAPSGIAPPPHPPPGLPAHATVGPSQASQHPTKAASASGALHLSPRPSPRHSEPAPPAGGSSTGPSDRSVADAGPPLNFFDAAGSAKTLKKFERDVPIPDKNGYILGDEFLPNSQCTPLLVFVNSRAGSQQGQFLMTQMRRLLNPIQVWDLADGGPETVLESFSRLTRMRILVCGGDGTVSWILSALEKMGKERWPPVGILPLGTGNDLARVHGWGGGYSNESLLLILEQLSEAYVSLLDRWEMTVQDRKGRIRKTSTFLNYFSVGMDAQAALQVHKLRESKPKLFFSRAVNKAWYAMAGAEDAIKASCADLPSQISLVADGVEVPLPPDSQGIIILNIDSYMGGVPLWSHGTRPLRRRRDRRYSESDFTSMMYNSSPNPRRDDVEIEDTLQELSYEERLAKITACDLPSSCQDGMLDVVSIRGSVHLGQIRVGLSNAQLVCQCREATIKLKKKIPIQIDGEPWRQNACTLRVKRKKDPAIMLHRSPDESGGVETEMANLLDWAEERKIIDQTVHATLMREFSRRIENKTRQRRVRSQENLFFSTKRPKFIGNPSSQ